ncbi:MAG: AMP-binding protein, partial [Ilumatobacteraceae bacterium]
MGPSTRLIERIVARSGTGSGESLALIDGDVELTFAQLTQRVESRACDFGLDDRSLVVLAGDRSIEYIVTYLALLHRGHVPLLAGAHADGLAERWDAAAVVTADADSTTIDHRPHEPVALHPDLALLMSTSGTTGSPKLVRLSHDNLLSNAESIAEYLDLRATDRGITSLPLHYCYGLSVLHSHLLVGAGVVATEASVVDPCFVAALERHGVTNVAGVPHTFELLERSGPERLHVPSLRLVTQAGGRLGPDAVRRWIGRTASWGVDFFVMYGQTEATARMAYLPPELGLARPETIGRAIPGGSFHLRRDDDLPEGVGELVYRGPNVMLGYAVERTDLVRGRDIDELSTGDLARFHEDEGVFEIVGRRSRFVKPLGLRVDLDAVESMVRELDG